MENLQRRFSTGKRKRNSSSPSSSPNTKRRRTVSPSMNVYYVRGHGATLPGREFTLGKNQYVVFMGKCGMPASMRTIMNTKVRNLLSDPNKINRFVRGNYDKSKFPIMIRNMQLIRPSQIVANMGIEMKNNQRFPNNPSKNALHRWYDSTAGVYRFKKGGESVYKQGRGNTKRLSELLVNRGYYVVDACRVLPGTTQEQANSTLRNILKGKNVRLPNNAFVRSVSRYEAELAKKQRMKRKFASENMSLRKSSSEPSPRRLKMTTVPKLPMDIIRNIFRRASNMRRKNIRNAIVLHRKQYPFDSYANTVRNISLSGTGYSPTEIRNQIKFLRERNIV